jgi:hypothetical protein
MRSLREIEGKTEGNRISNQTVRLGLGIIPHKQITELAELRWFGHVIRMGVERYQKIA